MCVNPKAVDVQLTVDRSKRAELMATERWLVRHVVRHIPGSAHD